jgi:hypothetical protein
LCRLAALVAGSSATAFRFRPPATGNNNAGWRRLGAVLLGFFDAAAVRFDAGNSCAKLRFKAAFRSMTGDGAVI